MSDELLCGHCHEPIDRFAHQENECRRLLRARIAKLEADLAKVRAERDKARDDLQATVAKVAENRLDGYRELAQRLNTAEADRDRVQRECGVLKKAQRVALMLLDEGMTHSAKVTLTEALSPAEPQEPSDDHEQAAIDAAALFEDITKGPEVSPPKPEPQEPEPEGERAYDCPDCDGDGEGKTYSMDYSDIPLCRTCKGTGRFQPSPAPTEDAER